MNFTLDGISHIIPMWGSRSEKCDCFICKNKEKRARGEKIPCFLDELPRFKITNTEVLELNEYDTDVEDLPRITEFSIEEKYIDLYRQNQILTTKIDKLEKEVEELLQEISIKEVEIEKYKSKNIVKEYEKLKHELEIKDKIIELFISDSNSRYERFLKEENLNKKC